MSALGGIGGKGAVNLYEDIGTVFRDESENPIREILGFENDWTVGRELWELPTEGFFNPTENDRKAFQLGRENLKLKSKYKTASPLEREKIIKEIMKNGEKIKKLNKK